MYIKDFSWLDDRNLFPYLIHVLSFTYLTLFSLYSLSITHLPTFIYIHTVQDVHSPYAPPTTPVPSAVRYELGRYRRPMAIKVDLPVSGTVFKEQGDVVQR
jgi:hypothetical protein